MLRAYDVLAKDFKRLLDDQSFSDVTFVVEGKKVHCHCNILAARSAKFKDMLIPMKDQHQRVIELKDISYSVFVTIVNFVTTGYYQSSADVTKELLLKSIEYGLNGLSKLVEADLSGQITVENVISTFCFAHQHNAKVLKSACMDFICGKRMVSDNDKSCLAQIKDSLDKDMMTDILFQACSYLATTPFNTRLQ